MRRTPLFSGLIYMILGGIFVVLATNDVQSRGWDFFSYLLVILATIDLGSGIKMIVFHFKYKDKLKK